LRDEWIKKMWYKHTLEYYSALKKKETLPCCQGLLGEGNGELLFKGYKVSTLQDN